MFIVSGCGDFIAVGDFPADPPGFQIGYGRFSHRKGPLGQGPVIPPPVISEIQRISKVSRHLHKMAGFSAARPETVKGPVIQIHRESILVSPVSSVAIWAIPKKKFLSFFPYICPQLGSQPENIIRLEVVSHHSRILLASGGR